MNTTSQISISQLRQHAARLVRHVKDSQEPVVIMTRSKPSAVLVDVDYFSSLEEAVMDVTDSNEAERALKESKRPLSSYIHSRWKKAKS